MPKKKHSKKEEELILTRKAQRGDEDALTILLDRYRVPLRVFANKHLRNTRDRDAEDAVQEAFVRIWKSIKTFDSTKASFSTWTHRITRNVCIDMLTSWQGEEDDRGALARRWDEELRAESSGGRVPGGAWSGFAWEDGDEKPRSAPRAAPVDEAWGEVDPVLKAKNEKIIQRMEKWDREKGFLPLVISSAEKATLGENTRPPKLSPREERILGEQRMGTAKEDIAEKEKTTPKGLKTSISRINKKFSKSVTS